MQPRKPIVWMGGSRSDLSAMPDRVRKDFGGALHAVQEGRSPDDAKRLKGRLRGAIQLSQDHDGDTFRAVYTIELEEIVYVLHCFQKKSKRGRTTPAVDLDLIERRLRDARMLHERRRRKIG
jgi:phage-related protein